MGYTGTKVRIKITASSRSVRLLWRGQMMGYEAGTIGAMSKPETPQSGLVPKGSTRVEPMGKEACRMLGGRLCERSWCPVQRVRFRRR